MPVSGRLSRQPCPREHYVIAQPRTLHPREECGNRGMEGVICPWAIVWQWGSLSPKAFFFSGVASLTNTSSLSKGPHDRWPGCHGRAHTENQRRPQPCHLIGVGSSEGKYTGTRRPRRFKQLYVNSCSCQIWQLLGWPTFLCQLQSETRLLPKVETRGLLGQACLYLLEWLHTSKRPSGLFLSSFSLSVTFSPTHFPALFCQILSALHVKNIP